MMSEKKMNVLLIVLVVIISFAPLFLVKNAEFGGADGEAEQLSRKSLQTMNLGSNRLSNLLVVKLKAYSLPFRQPLAQAS